LDLGRGEGDGGVVVGVEEVRGAQVAVAVLGVGVDAGGLDGDRDGRVRRGGGVDVGGAREVAELTADGGDHRVAGREAEARVRRVDGVVAGDVVDRLGGGVEGVGVLVAVEDAHGVVSLRVRVVRVRVVLFNVQLSNRMAPP